MDYKKTIAALAVAATTAAMAEGIVSSSVVGYQNATFENKGYNIAAATFVPVVGDADDMTLGDLVPNDDFVDSSICFLTSGGATAKVTFGGKQVAAKYVYAREEDEPEDGIGWYLFADDDYSVNQNDVAVPFGSGYLISRSGAESDAALVYSGAVKTTPTALGFAVKGYNITGNCSPIDITLGDITPNDDFVDSSICFLTSGGATAKVTFGGKQVAAKYVYARAEDEPEDGIGWYLFADDDYSVNQNDLVIKAGEGFLVSRSGAESDATLTIPSAL